jgi:hypothetical protein
MSTSSPSKQLSIAAKYNNEHLENGRFNHSIELAFRLSREFFKFIEEFYFLGGTAMNRMLLKWKTVVITGSNAHYRLGKVAANLGKKVQGFGSSNPITREAFQMGFSISSAVFEKIGDHLEPAIAVDFNELQYAQKRSFMKSKEWGNILNRYAGDYMSLFRTDDDPAQRLTEMAKGIDAMLAESRITDAQNSEVPG